MAWELTDNLHKIFVFLSKFQIWKTSAHLIHGISEVHFKGFTEQQGMKA